MFVSSVLSGQVSINTKYKKGHIGVTKFRDEMGKTKKVPGPLGTMLVWNKQDL